MIGSNGLDLKRCVACPSCPVMLGDAVADKKASGQAKDTLEVIDVAQLLARSVSTTATTEARPPQTGPRPPLIRRSERIHDKGKDEMVTNLPARPIH